MAKSRKPGLMSQLLTHSSQAAFRQAYQRIRVDEVKYLKEIKRAHKLPIESWNEMFYLGPQVVNPIATRTISSASKMAGLQGMGFGFGGFLTAVPDIGLLAAITLRMLQKLSLLYGFEYKTESDHTELWIAGASAAGLDLGRDFVGKQAAERLVPRIIDRIAMKAGVEVAEKWAGRLVPVVSAGAAGAINYYFVRAWGRRAQKHFLARHREVASKMDQPLPFARSRAPLILAPSSSR